MPYSSSVLPDWMNPRGISRGGEIPRGLPMSLAWEEDGLLNSWCRCELLKRQLAARCLSTEIMYQAPCQIALANETLGQFTDFNDFYCSESDGLHASAPYAAKLLAQNWATRINNDQKSGSELNLLVIWTTSRVPLWHFDGRVRAV